jgi:hypothetical protein
MVVGLARAQPQLADNLLFGIGNGQIAKLAGTCQAGLAPVPTCSVGLQCSPRFMGWNSSMLFGWHAWYCASVCYVCDEVAGPDWHLGHLSGSLQPRMMLANVVCSRNRLLSSSCLALVVSGCLVIAASCQQLQCCHLLGTLCFLWPRLIAHCP